MNIDKKKVFTVSELVSILKLELEKNIQVITGKKGFRNKLDTIVLNRPGLTLAGYFENFAYDRIQLFGRGECNYLISLKKDKRRRILKKFCSFKVPCCFFSYNKQPDDLFIELANQNNISLISVNLSTSRIDSLLHEILERQFSLKEQFHGVMVEVFGMGVLILGKSGVGKSEAALELVTKGHRLIADDVVNVSKVGISGLTANGTDLIKYHLEVRGIGIIDIQSLFGVGSIRGKKQLDMVVMLEEWVKDKEYERIGIDEQFYEVLGVKVPLLLIPVKPGRNISVIIETAVRNKRIRMMGVKAPEILNKQIKNLMRPGK